MKKVAMIFNGVHFEQAVADKALAYAKQSGEDAIAIFLTAGAEESEGYGFPSDLDAAQALKTDADAIHDDAKIIQGNMRLLQHTATGEKINIVATVLENPIPDQMNEALKDVGIIFIQGHDEHGDETPAAVDVKKLLESISIPVEIVQGVQ